MVVTMKLYAVNWVKASGTFVVRSVTGATIAEVDTLPEAWLIEEGLQREHDQRVRARREQAVEAGVVRARRMRSAAARVRFA